MPEPGKVTVMEGNRALCPGGQIGQESQISAAKVRACTRDKNADQVPSQESVLVPPI